MRGWRKGIKVKSGSPSVAYLVVTLETKLLNPLSKTFEELLICALDTYIT